MDLATFLKILEALACGRHIVARELPNIKYGSRRVFLHYRSQDELETVYVINMRYKTVGYGVSLRIVK